MAANQTTKNNFKVKAETLTLTWCLLTYEYFMSERNTLDLKIIL